MDSSCSLLVYVVFACVVAWLLVSIIGQIAYSAFRGKLAGFISNAALEGRGDLDAETGGLFVRHFVRRDYRAFGNPELTALGDRARLLILVSLGLASLFVLVLLPSSLGPFRGCYAF